jgi:hypothetical protein
VSDRLELANAIEAAGIERAKAERVVSAIVDLVNDSAATKADVQASEDAVRDEITANGAATRADIADSEASVRALLASENARLDTRIQHLDAKVEQVGSRTFNRLGTLMVALMVVLTGIILAALRYLPPGHSG